MALYFAYGLNMDEGRLKQQCDPGTYRRLATARLSDHAFAITRNATGQAEDVADIVERKGALVWGALFELSDEAIGKLDIAVGAALPQPAYRRETVSVTVQTADGGPVRKTDNSELANGAQVEAQTHVVANKLRQGVNPASYDYMTRIFASALQSKLPVAYIRGIAATTPGLPDFSFDDIRVGALDMAQEKIDRIYTVARPRYAVYRTSRRVVVQFADDESEAKNQRGTMARLNGLRTQITGLIDGWRTSRSEELRCKVELYESRVGAALILCLEGDPPTGLASLQEMKDDIVAERTSRGRFEYMLFAFAALLISIVVFSWLQRIYPVAIPSEDMWLAARSGSVGAFFSIALGIRGRTVLTNLHRRDNAADAFLRITIGAIAAILLVMLLSSGLLADAQIFGTKISGPDLTWQKILGIGFVAGFLERLVPDLLARASPENNAPASTPTANIPAGPR